MATKDIVNYVVTILEALHYHELVTPEGGGEPVPGPEIKYFPHVWAAAPKKIPDNNKRIAMVEIVNIPNIEYTTCPSHGKKEIDIAVTIGIKGEVERAGLAIYDLSDIVEAALNDMGKMGGIIYASQVQSIMYGPLMQSVNGKHVFTAAEIEVKVITGVN